LNSKNNIENNTNLKENYEKLKKYYKTLAEVKITNVLD